MRVPSNFTLALAAGVKVTDAGVLVGLGTQLRMETARRKGSKGERWSEAALVGTAPRSTRC